MRKQVICWALMAILLIWGISPVLAQQSQVQITSPEMGAEVRGLVVIRGSASVPNFQFYKIEFGVGPNPSQWAIVGSLHETPVINGQLEVWDTTKIPDGVYTLRLQAVKRDGNYDEFFVRQLSVVNTRPTATPTPTAAPTTRPVVTVASPTPRATATLLIIAPTAALAQPTATPTLSRPSQRSNLPLNPEGWGQAFCFGALAMGAALILLGIVFGLRRLL